MPAPFVNWYKILQVDPEADQEVIGAAYRKLASRYHPDVSADPSAATRMVQINAAWNVLGDPGRRAAFDLDRQSRSRSSSGSGPRPSTNPAGAGSAGPRPRPTTSSTNRAGPGPSSGSASGGTDPANPLPDRPILAITPPEIELWVRSGEEYASFTVSVGQVDGPAWVPGRHNLEISLEPPWQLDMFSKVATSGTEPPFLIDFEIKLATLEAARNYAGNVQVAVRVITVS